MTKDTEVKVSLATVTRREGKEHPLLAGDGGYGEGLLFKKNFFKILIYLFMGDTEREAET